MFTFLSEALFTFQGILFMLFFCFGQHSGNAYSNQCIHFYICNGNGNPLDAITLCDAISNRNHICDGAEYNPEPEALALIQS